MDTATVVSTSTSPGNRGKDASQLVYDARFVERLYGKLRSTFMERGANGIVQMRDNFLTLDKRVTADTFSADVWAMKSLMSPHIQGVTDLELDVLFLLLDTDEDGLVDMAEVVMTIRKLFRCTTQQFHEIIKRVRAKRLPRERCSFLIKAAKKGTATRKDVFEYLVSAAECTQSEAFLFLDYCTPQGNELDGANGELDLDYCESVLFQFPLADDVAFPLLSMKFVEAASDPTKRSCGTVGILEMMRRCADPTYVRDSDGNDVACDIMEWVVDKSGFVQFSSEFGTGLPAVESGVLFSYICDRNSGQLPVRNLIKLFQERLRPPSRDEFSLILTGVRGFVMESPGGFSKLFTELYNLPPNLPLAQTTRALRNVGVRQGIIGDVSIELLLREADGTQALIHLLRGEIPDSRNRLIRQLFALLDLHKHGSVDCYTTLERFQPQALDGHLRRLAVQIQEEFHRYAETLVAGSTTISEDEFVFFWSNISATISDDSSFTMMLWKGFAMQDPRGRNPNSLSVRRDGPESGNVSVRSRTPRRRMLE